MSKVSKDDAFYRRLHQKLLETSSWPGPYMFKFIIPASDEIRHELMKLFSTHTVTSSVRASSKGTYASISISGTFENPDVIIDKHQQAAKIPNIIQL